MSAVLQVSHPQISVWPSLSDVAGKPFITSAQGPPETGSSRTTGKPKAKNSSCRLTKAELNRAVFSRASVTSHQHGTRKPQCLGFPTTCLGNRHMYVFSPWGLVSHPGLGSTLPLRVLPSQHQFYLEAENFLGVSEIARISTTMPPAVLDFVGSSWGSGHRAPSALCSGHAPPPVG